MQRIIPLVILSLLLLFSCKTKIDNLSTSKKVIMNEPTESGIISSIDLPVRSFFWMLRTWKEGTLVTIDENARFSELSFVGENHVKIKPLVEFPDQSIDRMLSAYPEQGLIISKSARMFHVADITTGRTTSFVPKLTGLHDELTPILLDSEVGLIAFPYLLMPSVVRREGDVNFFVVYNYKENQTLGIYGETELDRSIHFSINPKTLIAQTFSDNQPLSEIYFYNWQTDEKIENELTKKLSRLVRGGLVLDQFINIDLQRRYLFFRMISNDPNQSSLQAKITWEEGFTNVNMIPLNYLIPNDKWLNNFFLSSCGTWATNFVGGYRGLSNESLVKRVFFHLDERYPNGISMPIFTDGYDTYHWDQGAFVNHPVYGMCFADRVEIKQDGKERQYLRLYKMSDVLAEINKEMSE